VTADVAAREGVADTAAPAPRRRPWLWVVALAVTTGVLVAVTIAVAATTSPTTTLTIVLQDDGRVVFERSVEVGERFELTHTHSVTQREIIETFSALDASTVAIEELWFDEHGANLPTGSERMGETTTTYLEEPGGYRVLHHGHPIGSLALLVGSPSVDHELRFADGERVRLLDVAPAGARVEVNLGR
jgi:hypothetical protein